MAGVLLVFCILIIPAAAAALRGGAHLPSPGHRLGLRHGRKHGGRGPLLHARSAHGRGRGLHPGRAAAHLQNSGQIQNRRFSFLRKRESAINKKVDPNRVAQLPRRGRTGTAGRTPDAFVFPRHAEGRGQDSLRDLPADGLQGCEARQGAAPRSAYLWHCKYSQTAEPGRRADDLYEVCGQAQKSIKWTWSLHTLIRHLMIRETKHACGRESRFIRGSTHDLATLRKGARRKFVSFKIGIVQPGLSRGGIPNDHLAIIGSTNSLVQTIQHDGAVQVDPGVWVRYSRKSTGSRQ